jgi:nicotinic acid phosphoribosyltransferase
MPGQFATLAGSVLRLDTGQPLKKAKVLLLDITDAQGHFNIEKVDPGSYRLVVSRNGFVDAHRPRADGDQ